MPGLEPVHLVFSVPTSLLIVRIEGLNIINMSSIHGSPSKSKSKEDDYWQPGWWELQSFVEYDERSVC